MGLIRTCIFIWFLLFSTLVSAQDSTKYRVRHTAVFNYGGNGASFGGQPWWFRSSVSYELIFSENRGLAITLRAGTNFPLGTSFHSPFSDETTHIMPLMLGFNIGKRNTTFEFAVGADLLVFDSDYVHVYTAPTAFIGARYQRNKQGWLIRLGLTPTLGNIDDRYPQTSYNHQPFYFGSWIGIGIGYTFGAANRSQQ